MVIQKVVLAVVLAVFCVVSGCNCPCMDEKTCTMPESEPTGQQAASEAVVH